MMRHRLELSTAYFDVEIEGREPRITVENEKGDLTLPDGIMELIPELPGLLMSVGEIESETGTIAYWNNEYAHNMLIFRGEGESFVVRVPKGQAESLRRFFMMVIEELRALGGSWKKESQPDMVVKVFRGESQLSIAMGEDERVFDLRSDRSEKAYWAILSAMKDADPSEM